MIQTRMTFGAVARAVSCALFPVMLWASPVFPGEPVETGQAPRPDHCRRLNEENATAIRGRVVSHADGDTLKVADSQGTYSVRLLSIDTPETHFNGHSQGYWGEQAAARLREIAPVGAEVEVRFDVERCDSYKRLLGYVYVGERFVNQQLVEDALAVSYCIFPNEGKCAELGQITQSRADAKAGMFSDPDLQIPYEYRRVTNGQPRTKYVGNVRTKEVFRPDSIDRVPLGERIFFGSPRSIRPPYRLAE